MILNDLIVFIYESGICLAVLFAMYWLFLRRETYFRFNRFYLLASVLIAFTLPLLTLGLFETGNDISALGGFSNVVDTIRIPAATIETGSGSTFSLSDSWKTMAIVVYLSGAFLLLVRTVLGVVRVGMLKRRARVVYHKSYSIAYIEQKLAPFSFLKTIYINDSLTEVKDRSYIISHESIHIRQLHTYDNLFVEFFLAIFWFNPFMWFLKGALRNTHEYLADNGVLNGNTNRTRYQSLLLKQILGLSPLPVTSSFNSTIKKRITMMCKNKSSLLAKFKPLLLVPIITFLMLVFACNEEPETPAMENLPGISADEIEMVAKSPEGVIESPAETDTVERELFYVVEDMPEFNGGDAAIEFRKFIAQNLQYPARAEENGTEGRVIIQFAVNSKGKVVDATVVRSVDPDLDREALRVVNSSPEWEPGRQKGKAVTVLYTFPINFVVQ
jgi:bla regulator protein blaR1